MEKQYKIYGLSCEGCVASAKQDLESVEGINTAKIDLHAELAVLDMYKEVSLKELQSALRTYELKDEV